MAKPTFKEDPSAAAELTFREDPSAAAELEGKKKLPAPRSQRMSRDPTRKGEPESVQEENERLGIDTGLIRSVRVPGVGATISGGPEELGGEGKANYIDRVAGDIGRAESAAGTAAVGGILGAAAKGAMAARLAGKAAPVVDAAGPARGLASFETLMAKAGKTAGEPAKSAMQAVGDALKHTTQTAILGAILGHGAGHGITGAIAGAALPFVAKGAAKIAPAVGGAAVRGAANVAPAAGAAIGGDPVGPAPSSLPESPALPSSPQSSLHNAVDRLRANAANNPRAAEFLARMEASRNTPNGTVTQSTGAA